MLDFPRWKMAVVLVVCIIFAAFALPTFLSPQTRAALPDWFPTRTLNLGLDLRGGSHLLLELDSDAYLREQIANVQDNLRTQFRAKKIVFSGLSVSGTSVRVKTEATTEQLTEILREVQPGLSVDKDGDITRIVFSDREAAEIRNRLLEQSMEIVNRRVNESGTREPIIQRQGDNRILVQVPGLQDPAHLKNILGKTAKMTFHLVDDQATPEEIAGNRVGLGTRVLPSDDPSEVYADGKPVRYAIKSRVVLSGDRLTNASATYEQGRAVVAFTFDTAGAKAFGRITSANVGKPFAIVLDDKVITAPRINSPILGGSGIISGNFTVQTANDLALLLRAGALPAPLEVVEERTVGPSLGADSIEAGTAAAYLAMAMITLFMFLAYGLFGIFADLALLVNVVLILGALSLFNATLTLPGIAGIVLTFGMAVDANVLIFERIREELRAGRSMMAALDNGFKNAFATILDANLTTLIAALLLFYFGTGTIKGFAVTLSIGIVSSIFSAVLITRLLVVAWLHFRRPKAIPI